ncbi:MAG: DUF937 domain-containing protein [Lysobacterales bacterium]|jgi:hypothetical protein
MDLLKLLDNVGGAQSLGNLAGNLGLDASKANDLVGALAPALMDGLKKQAGAEGGLAGLTKALQTGNHQRYVDNPELMSSEETRLDGNKILGHLLGSKDTSRNVAAQAAESTGIDAGLIKQALPMIAGLAMGALSKGSDAGNASADSIGGMLGGLVGEGFGVDDALNLAKKFF